MNKKWKLFLISTLLMNQPVLLPAKAPHFPVNIEFDCKYDINIPRPISIAVNRYDPDFTVWAQKNYLKIILDKSTFSPWESPSAVIGEFTAYKKDIILAGHNKNFEMVIAVVHKPVTRFSVSEEIRKKAEETAASLFYRVVEIYKSPLKTLQEKELRLSPSLFLSRNSPYPGNADLKKGFAVNLIEGTKIIYRWDRKQKKFIGETASD